MESKVRKLIVHTGTGTIIDADECVIIDLNRLNEKQTSLINDGDDSDIVELAKLFGKPLNLTEVDA